MHKPKRRERIWGARSLDQSRCVPKMMSFKVSLWTMIWNMQTWRQYLLVIFVPDVYGDGGCHFEKPARKLGRLIHNLREQLYYIYITYYPICYSYITSLQLYYRYIL